MKIGLIAFVFLFFGCYTPKKAQKDLDKVLDEYPEKVASVCKDKYPCVDGRIDTIEKVYYDLIEVECPELIKVINKTDTVTLTSKKYITRYVKGKDIIITKVVKDSSELFLLNDKIQKTGKELSQTLDKLADSKGRNKTLWIIFLAIIASLLVYILMKRK